MGWKVQQRWLEDTLHQLFRRVQEMEGRGREKKPCFCISVPPASGDNTQNRCTLHFNSLSKRLLFVPLCFFSFFMPLLFLYTPPYTSVLTSGGFLNCSQTTTLSQSVLFDDLHYILFAWWYGGLTCCVCINCGVNDSNKRKAQPYEDWNESAYHCRGHAASREPNVV